MKHLPFIRSLMEFNKRVLSQGSIENPIYDMNDLQQKLFFNQVFMGNTHEMFQRYPDSNIMEDYVELLNEYITNVSKVINTMTSIRRDIRIGYKSTFESRLIIEGFMSDCMITKWYQLKDLDIKVLSDDLMLLDGKIYYLSIYWDMIAITFIDPKRSVYHNLIHMEFPGYTMYWKTDEAICDYLNRKFGVDNTVAVKSTRSTKGKITKIEFNGNSSTIEKIVGIFPKTALIVSNPYIYTDDIKMIIEFNTKAEVARERTSFTPIELDDIFIKDRLIEYPRDSFDQYLQLLDQASKNPHVKSIFLTLYRIGNDPAIFYILRDAVTRGVDVRVNIELCASGETINTLWMDEMIRVGINVTTYGFQEIKVHSKLTLIKFDNGRSICQIGTGNYHSKTTSQYTDLSLVTADESICRQVESVFGILCEEETVEFGHDLLVTPYNFRREIIKLIDREGNKGKDGYISFKCNSLDDEEISKRLKDASSKGCKMDLVVRGVCTFIPDEIGRNVKVKSIVWDKLEHSRVYCFGNENPTIYMGSLDLVTKKIDQRIETLVRIKDPDVMIRIINYLNSYITNTKKSWLMTRSGMYIKER